MNVKRRHAIEDLYILFRIETACLPRGYRPGEANDVLARDAARGIVSKYNSLKTLRGQVPLWLRMLGYPAYSR